MSAHDLAIDDSLYAWVGLPPPEPHHHEVGVRAAAADPKPTPLAMGDTDTDVESIIYLNLAKKVPAEMQARLTQLEADLKLSNQWLSIKAGVATQKKLNSKELPSGLAIDEQLKRAGYRAKVIDTFMTSLVPWIAPYAVNIRKNSINVRKSEFHLELLRIVLSGITVPTQVHEKLEAILKAISSAISSSAKSAQQKQFYWILLSVYKYDERMNAVIPTVRSIYFNVDQELRKYVTGKSSYETASFVFGFAQSDYQFNEVVWNGVRKTVEDYLIELGIDIIRQTPDIPVD